jgi:Flp pilus assembly protein TadG
MKPFVLFLKRLRRDRRGVTLVEFALVAPILVTMIIGGFEISRYVLIQQKLNGVSASMADLVAQAETLSAAELSSLFTSVDYLIKPFEFGSDGVVIVSSIGAVNGGAPTVFWQRKGGGTLTHGSEFGNEGQPATLPTGFVIRSGESMIVAEVFFTYSPLLGEKFVTTKELYHRAFLRPRFGALQQLM